MITVGYDTIGADVHLLPPGAKQVAGYTTGSPNIIWSSTEWALHPGAVRICQDAGATDRTADVLDIESGAATLADAGPWYKAASIAHTSRTRPGQRLPCLYTSVSNVTPLVNALIGEGVHSGPRLWIAHWGVSQAAAVTAVTEAGPFPVVAFQFADPGPYDVDLFADDWLASAVSPPPPALPQWAQVAIADCTTAATMALSARSLIQANVK